MTRKDERHGDFNAKLKYFRLVRDAARRYGLGDESVERVLFEYIIDENERDKLRPTVRSADYLSLVRLVRKVLRWKKGLGYGQLTVRIDMSVGPS